MEKIEIWEEGINGKYLAKYKYCDRTEEVYTYDNTLEENYEAFRETMK